MSFEWARLAPNRSILLSCYQPLFSEIMLDREDVKKVADLARLALTEAETDAFTGQLAQILDYVEQLNELDTDNVLPTAHAIDMRNVTRPDTLEIYEHREDVLNSAPARDGDFFRVPKIL